MSVRPFSNGTELHEWRTMNCHQCALYNRDRFDGRCDIDRALGMAYIGDGEVPDYIAERMGDPVDMDCPELELVPA